MVSLTLLTLWRLYNTSIGPTMERSTRSSVVVPNRVVVPSPWRCEGKWDKIASRLATRSCLGLRPAQDGAGLGYPRPILRRTGWDAGYCGTRSLNILRYIYFVTTRSADTWTHPYALSILKNNDNSWTVKHFSMWLMLTCYNKGISSMPYPLDPNRCCWWQTHARRAFQTWW